jgi:hypothetical protein
MTSTHSSYRLAPVSFPLSYRQTSSLRGFRPSPPTRSYSPDQDDGDKIDASINAMPLTTNRSRTNTPFGSHKSLSKSIQSLRSNQQPALSLPVKNVHTNLHHYQLQLYQNVINEHHHQNHLKQKKIINIIIIIIQQH